MLGLGKLGDVVAGALHGDELAPAGQRNRIVEFAIPGHAPALAAPNMSAEAPAAKSRRDR